MSVGTYPHITVDRLKSEIYEKALALEKELADTKAEIARLRDEVARLKPGFKGDDAMVAHDDLSTELTRNRVP